MMTVRRSLAFSFTQRGVHFLIVLTSTALLSRLLAPAEIGAYSVAVAVTGLALIIRDFGVGRYIVQAQEVTPAHLRSALGVSLALGLPLGAVIAAAAPLVASFYSAPELVTVMRILALSFVLTPFTTPALAHLERELSFNLLLRVGLASSLTHAITGVSAAAAGLGAVSLALASVAGVCMSLAMLQVFCPAQVIYRPSLSHWRQIAGFGGKASLAGAINHLGTQAPDLVIGRALGLQPVGFYSRASGLLLMFEQQFMNAIASVAMPSYARSRRLGHALKEDYLRAVTYLTGCAWPFFGLLGLLAEPIILILFGQQWLPSAPLVPALCIAATVSSISFLAPQLMLASGRPGMVVRFAASSQFARFGLVALAAIGVGRIEAVAWAQVPAALISFAAATWLLRSLTHIRLGEILLATAPSAAVAAAALIPAALMDAWLAPSGPAVQAICVSAVAGVAWIVGLFILKHPLAAEILRLGEYIPGIRAAKREP